MLNNQDMAALANKLMIPGAVREILDMKDLSDDTRYCLHEILSEQQPDTALLSIAMAAKIITAPHLHIHPTIAILQNECRRIIDDYAQLWLLNARGENVDAARVQEQLLQSPEDLEDISAMLETVSYFLQDHDALSAELCRILMVQADAQNLIAQSFAEALVIGELTRHISVAPAGANDLSVAPEEEDFALPQSYAVGMGPERGFAHGTNDNVIQFPQLH